MVRFRSFGFSGSEFAINTVYFLIFPDVHRHETPCVPQLARLNFLLDCERLIYCAIYLLYHVRIAHILEAFFQDLQDHSD
jgi:hypothetical protein